ncbi:hypothetical protein UPYG_G00125640 [Umbra pygmaea]|uniref:Jhy protein homolog n=1 Tax=Umbra pygmaea TaxID=75934 RepID=A0ABD0XL78_UMBPY
MECKNKPGYGETDIWLKDERGKPFSPKPGVDLSLWDSTESETESLFHERAYQLELQRRIGESADQISSNTQKDERGNSYLREDDDDEEDEQDEEGLHVYDSLEVSAGRHNNKNARLNPIKFQLQHKVNVVSRPNNCDNTYDDTYDDTYAELRYDPDWRTNLKEAGAFERISQLALNEAIDSSDVQSEEKVVDSGEENSRRGGYTYINARSSSTIDSVTPEVSILQSKHPLITYHLHPQQDEATREVSPAPSLPHHLYQNQVAGERVPESTCRSPGLMPLERTIERKSYQRVKASRGVRNQTNVPGGENRTSSPDLEESYREVQQRYDGEIHVKEDQAQYGQSSGTVTEKPSQNPTSSVKSKGSLHLSHRKPDKPRDDIIERNRVTLGINTAKQGSYLRAHVQQKEVTSHSSNQPSDSTEENSIIGSQDIKGSQADNSDPELRWLQKTTELKVAQISKEKKVQQRENLNPPSENTPPAQGGKVRPRDCDLSPTSDRHRPAASSQAQLPPQHSPHLQARCDTEPRSIPLDTWSYQPQYQHVPLSQPPTIQLNIDRSTSSEPLSILHHTHQKAVLTTAPGPPWDPHVVDGNRTNSNAPLGNAAHFSANSHPSPYPVLQDSLVPRAAGSPPSPGQGFHHQTSQHPWKQGNHVVLEVDHDDSHRSTSTAQIQPYSGPYKVLPPIGQTTTTTGDPNLGRQGAAKGLTSMQRSSSDGYLTQIRTEKQWKERVTYKAYTLKDYKQLMLDVKLGGLGPDYATTEITAEKIRRQKLYSNVIREQNKKISRIPFLPAARIPVGSDNRDNIPRMKALEYARSILKPKVSPQPQQPKSREPERPLGGVRDTNHLLEGSNPSQLATLEALRKRHEQEKETVARFKVVHAI